MIIKLIPSAFKSVFVVLKILSFLKRQKQYLKENIHPVLEDGLQNNDGTIEDKDLRKIKSYYGLAVPAILGESMSLLHGRKMTESERKCTTCQGAMTGLFDDFFDDGKLEDEDIRKKIFYQPNNTNQSSNERLFDRFYSEALNSCASPMSMKECLFQVYEAQVESKKQISGETSIEEIKRITILKGGTSLLFYRSGLSGAISAEEKRYLMAIGGLMQLSNDIFDIYKDLQSGIRTLITETGNVEEVEKYFNDQLKACFSLGGLSARSHQRKFLEIISLGIFSRVFVCLDQLKKNQRSTDNIFTPKNYSRSQLICDMDRKKNMLRSAAYHMRIMGYFN